MSFVRVRMTGPLVLLLFIVLAGCKSTPRPVAKKSAQSFLQAYVVHGEIKEVKPEERSVVIRHEEIPGYMPAMTMPFPVKNLKELAGIHPGDEVQFRMIVTTNDGWVEKIHVTKPAPVKPAPPRNSLPAAAPVRVVRDMEPLNVGDQLPGYTFTNQLGEAVSLGQFRGQALAITFIFTRCPFPTYCPLMTGNFAEVQEKLKAASAPTNWHLLTLSFDPEYDTPVELKKYAERYAYDPARWSFLTGSLMDITALSEQSGLMFWREQPTEPINHNLRTLVVDARGRVQKIFSNNTWTSAELAAELTKAAESK